MFKKRKELHREKSCWDGIQIGDLIHLAGRDELPPNLRFYALSVIYPGKEIGYHQHCGEMEIFHIISGHGEIKNNGELLKVSPGDVVTTPNNGWHGMRNTGKDNLVFSCLIITCEKE